MIVVVDANILISAYTVDGCTRERWRHSLEGHRLVVSPEIFSEVERNLRGAEFNLSSGEVRAILLDILDRCEVLRPTVAYDGPVPHEKDRHLASLAKDIGADRIVSGEHKLQDTQELGGIPVLGLADLVDELRAGTGHGQCSNEQQ